MEESTRVSKVMGTSRTGWPIVGHGRLLSTQRQGCTVETKVCEEGIGTPGEMTVRERYAMENNAAGYGVNGSMVWVTLVCTSQE